MEHSRIHLFQGFGVELEYMIVDRDTLQVKPITDELLKHVMGKYDSDYENGIVTWSNELVLHVVEIKSTNPESNFNVLENEFVQNIKRINEILRTWNAMLMPSAAHPFMDPSSETKLWPHDNNEVYTIYNRIFDCQGHGWSNLQSTHLNLPFYDDEEFAKLHAAIRLILPLLPALCASSPILNGTFTGAYDTRLRYYKTNQSKIPSITGKVIPEAVFSKRNYLNTIYERIKSDIAPYDPDSILNPIWVNSRGAIPRFDRGSIEIRIMDIQECPAADLAILTLVIQVIKAMVEEKFIGYDQQVRWRTEDLAKILDVAADEAQDAVIQNQEYLSVFGFSGKNIRADELWSLIWNKVASGNTALIQTKPEIDVILKEGTLAKRIIRATGEKPEKNQITLVYKKLGDCLVQNKMFRL